MFPNREDFNFVFNAPPGALNMTNIRHKVNQIFSIFAFFLV